MACHGADCYTYFIRMSRQDFPDVLHAKNLRCVYARVVSTKQAKVEIAGLNGYLKRVLTRPRMTTSIVRYGAAALSVTAAVIITLLMRMGLGQLSTPIVAMFLSAVMFSAWFGGLGPGVFAIALSLLAIKYYFAIPVYSLAVDIKELPRLLIFTLSALFVGSLSAAQRGAAESLRRARDALDGTVHQLKRTNESLLAEIAERKQADEKLQRSESLLADAQEIAHVGSWTWDIRSGRLTWSDELYRIFGLDRTASPPTNDSFLAALHPGDRARMTALIDAACRGSATYDCDFRTIRPDGEMRVVYSRGKVIRNAAGQAIEMIGTGQDITARKRIEETLKRSESLLAEAQQLAHIGSWNLDLQSGAFEWSDEHYRIFGYAPHEPLITLDRAWNHVHPDDRTGVQELLAQAIRDRRSFECSFRLLLPDGTMRTVQSRGRPALDEDGNAVRMFGTIQDITERTREQEALRASEERFRVAVKASPAILAFNQDKDLRYTWFPNPQRHSPDELLGKTDADLLGDADAAHLTAIKVGVLESGVGTRREVSVTSGGQTRCYDQTIEPLRDASGQVSGITCIAIDITDQNRSQEALRASEERVRLLLESTAEAIYGIDLEGKCTFSNPACLRLLGYRDPGDVLGRSMHELTHHTRRDGTPYPREMCPILRAFLRDEEVHADDEVLWRADGTSFPVEYWSHPIRRDGLVVGAVVTFLDITERKRMEQQLLEISERERRRIGQDLHDDLCQQLTGIAFTGRLLQRRLAARSVPEADVAEKIVLAVQQATARARDLAKGLHPVMLEADGLAAALMELTHTLESVFQISCRFRCRAPRKSVRVADPAIAIQLYRIAQESATNAVKHGKAKDICISIGVVKGRLKLAIADDGVGIAGAAHREGMGLPVMHQRARIIGAALTISPRKQGGTLVTCSL